MVLTDRQQRDLHVAILEYLRDLGGGYAKSAEAFAADAGLAGEAVPSGTALLEKKWTSVVRLQKKVMELEEKLAAMEQELRAGGRVGAGAGGAAAKPSGDGSRNLPRAPPSKILTGHRGPVTCLATHPVFAMLASGSEDATIKTWDMESGDFEATLKGHTNAVQSVSFNKTGTLLASSSSDLSIKLWDFTGSSPGHECLRTLRGHDHSISAVLFLPNTEHLVSASRDQSIKMWEVGSGYCVKTLTGHTDWVRCLAVSGDGTLLASGGSDHSVLVWPLATAGAGGTEPLALREHTHVVESVAFPPPGAELKVEGAAKGERHEYVVSGSRDKTVRVWDAITGQLLMTFSDHENWVRCVRVHSSGAFVLSCSDDRSIRVLDVAKARCLRTLSEAHQQFVTCLTQHPSLPYLASGGVDKEVRVWDCR